MTDAPAIRKTMRYNTNDATIHTADRRYPLPTVCPACRVQRTNCPHPCGWNVDDVPLTLISSRHTHVVKVTYMQSSPVRSAWMAERGTTATAIGRPVQIFTLHSMLQDGKAQHPPTCTTAVLTFIHWEIARLRNQLQSPTKATM